jgi:hypothetical protein
VETRAASFIQEPDLMSARMELAAVTAGVAITAILAIGVVIFA